MSSPSRDRKRPFETSRDRSRSRERDYKRAREDGRYRDGRDARFEWREDRREDRRDPRYERERLDRRPDDRRYERHEEERHKERDRDRGRDRPRDRDKDRGRDSEHGRPRGEERESDRDRRRDRSPGKGHERKPDEEEEQKLNGDANGDAEKNKAEPLSLEELLKKRKQQQEEEAKPRFISKKEREELALKRREEEAAQQRLRYDEMRRRYQGNNGDARREEAARQSAEAQRHQDERAKEKELELIRNQYLGGQKEKKKVMKASEKFRFNFDWDAKEDTSKDLNPLYNQPHEVTLLFGRGMRAGIDRREQKKQAAAMEGEILRKGREAAGIEETMEMKQVQRDREDRAAKYDAQDMVIDKHWSEKQLKHMTERDWRIFREDFNISYRGHNPTLPLRSWDEANLPDPLAEAITFVGYKEPSPIQRAAMPLGMKQLDVIGIAETGSGKTAAFVIPMLAYIMKQPPMDETNEADGPYAVVLAPTRELAQQIEEETVKLAHYTNYRVTSVVGGQSIEEQGSKLRRGCEIVIATPGRLLDCIERHYCVLNQCNYVVLDEADRMIDLGFEPQVQAVLDAMPSSNLKPEDEGVALDENRVYRTTYMFSATMPPTVERLARKYLRRPIIVTIGGAGKAALSVTQRVVMTKENEKPNRLEQELESMDEKKVIVFVNTKKQCDKVHSHLESVGYHCCVLHGGRTQDQREAGIKGFKEGDYNVLIATDVAGRGIDVPDVALVVNYDMPNNIEAYTHRIGRTGRAGRKGVALTFLTGHDTEVYYDLKKLLEDSKAVVPPELARHEAAKMKPGGPGQKRDSVIFAKK